MEDPIEERLKAIEEVLHYLVSWARQTEHSQQRMRENMRQMEEDALERDKLVQKMLQSSFIRSSNGLADETNE